MGLTLRETATRASQLVGMLLPIGMGLGISRLVSPYLPEFTAWVHTLGSWAPVAFVVGYVAVCVFMLPAFLLTMAGGAVFGVVKGSLLVVLGSTLGATTAFLLGRTVLRTWVAAQMARNATLVAMDRIIGQEGLRLMFLLRLSGIVPFVLTNYAMGVTTVTLRDFVLALVGIVPTVVTYAMLGQAGAATGEGSTPQWVVWTAISAAVLLAVTLTRMAQRAIREAESRAAA